MTDYKESLVTGQQSQHQRCYQIVVNNPYDSVPNVRFDEELLLTLPDGTKLNRHVGGMTTQFDPSKSVAIRNPLTWELTGQSMTMGEIYAVLASAYWQAALERDAG
jgi:hypothetical protein